MHIRDAVKDDAAAITTISIEGWRRAYRGIIDDAVLDGRSIAANTGRWAEWIKELAGRGNRIVVADDNGPIAGFASYGANRDVDNEFGAELYAIYVAPDRVGQGIGTALVRDMGRWLEAHGYRDVVVWCLTKNPYCRFYESHGARAVITRTIEIGSQVLDETGYGWHTLTALRGG